MKISEIRIGIPGSSTIEARNLELDAKEFIEITALVRLLTNTQLETEKLRLEIERLRSQHPMQEQARR